MKAKVIRLHVHRGGSRTVHVAFCVEVCGALTLDQVRLGIQAILWDAGATERAIRSVTCASVPAGPPPTGRAS